MPSDVQVLFVFVMVVRKTATVRKERPYSSSSSCESPAGRVRSAVPVGFAPENLQQHSLPVPHRAKES